RVAAAVWTRRALLLQHLWPTLWQCLAGFLLAALAGTLLGVAVSLSSAFRRAIYPHLVAFQVLPKVTVAPLFILWWGVGGTSRVLLAFFICFFPMVVNTLAGLASAEADLVRMARAFTASPRQVFWRGRLPAAPPSLLARPEVSGAFSVIRVV